MQTKMVRGMLIKDKEWSWFGRKEKNKKVKKEDEELFNFLDKIRLKNKLPN